MGELLLDGGRLVVQRVQRQGESKFLGVDVVVARLVLDHIVEVVGGLPLQTADGEFHVGSSLGGVGAALFQGTQTGFDLDLRGQRVLVRDAVCKEVRAALDHRPIEGGRLVHREGHGDGAGRHVGHADALKDGGRRIQRGDGELLHRGALAVVGVVEPEVEVVGGFLLQIGGVHTGDQQRRVLLHVHHAVAQIAGDGAGFEVGRRGRHGALGQQRVIEAAVLGGHDHGLHDLLLAGGVRFGEGHVGVRIAGGEGGDRVIRGGEGRDLHGAVPPAGVHQHGGDVVGAVLGEAGQLGGQLRFGGGDLDIAALDHGMRGGGVQQDGFIHGAVRQGGDGPVDRAALVGAEHGARRGGGHVPHGGIARQQAGILRGFDGGGGVHHRAADAAGHAGAHHDGVGQHWNGGAGGVDRGVGDVALAGHGGGGVQIQIPDGAVGADVQGGAGGPLVHRHLIGHAAADAQEGSGGAVDDLLDVTGKLELSAIGAVQLNERQALAVRRQILDIAGGAGDSVLDAGEALGPDAEVLVGHAVNLQTVRRHVPQDHAALALLTGAGAADHDLAAHGDIVEHHVVKADAAGEVEVAGDNGVAQGDAGGGDGEVAVNVAHILLAGLVHQRSDGTGEDAGGLTPGDGLLGAEGAVGIAADDAHFRGLMDDAPAPMADPAAVLIVQRVAGGILHTQAAADEHHGLFTGHGGVGRGGGGGAALKIARLVGDADVVGVPGVVRHVLKGVFPHFPVAEGPVDQGDEFRAGDDPLAVEVAVGVPLHHAPFLHLIEVGVHPGGGLRRLGQRQGNAEKERDAQQNACRAPRGIDNTVKNVHARSPS